MIKAGGPELGRMLWESIGTMYSLLEFGKEDAVYKVMIKIPFPPLSGTYPTIQVVEYSSVYYDSYKQNLQCTCPDSVHSFYTGNKSGSSERSDTRLLLPLSDYRVTSSAIRLLTIHWLRCY
nr:hypothetical protein [Tanacetum cinerariifolium]